MCFHNRLVFSCGHYIWLNIVRPCNVEEAFNKGDTSIGCNKMWSTGFCTMKVGQKCESCSAKEVKTAAQTAEIRRRIGELRVLVEKIISSSSSNKTSSKASSVSDRSSLGKKGLDEKEKEKEKQKRELLEAGVVFDDEYEARLEGFSPVKSGAFFSEA